MLQSRPAVRFSHRYQASFALICPLRPLGSHQENPASAPAGHTEPLAEHKGCVRWMQAECDRPEQWLHPEPCRSKWRLLQQSLKLKPIKLLRRFSIFIKRSIYFTYFFFIFRVTDCNLFFSFPFVILTSAVLFKKDCGSRKRREARTPGLSLLCLCLAGWLFIALLSLNCRSVESFATTFWGQNPEVFTARQNKMS